MGISRPKKSSEFVCFAVNTGVSVKIEARSQLPLWEGRHLTASIQTERREFFIISRGILERVVCCPVALL